MKIKVIKIIKETEKAELVEIYKFGKIWIPKSAIIDKGIENNKIYLSRWFENKLKLERMGIKNLPNAEIEKDLLDD